LTIPNKKNKLVSKTQFNTIQTLTALFYSFMGKKIIDFKRSRGEKIKSNSILNTTRVGVPKKNKTGFHPTIIFLFRKSPIKGAVAGLSIWSGTIIGVWLKFLLNWHWNQYFHYANFASVLDLYENFMVTLTMVPDRFENPATAHLMAFKQRKQMMAGESQFQPISALWHA